MPVDGRQVQFFLRGVRRRCQVLLLRLGGMVEVGAHLTQCLLIFILLFIEIAVFFARLFYYRVDVDDPILLSRGLLDFAEVLIIAHHVEAGERGLLLDYPLGHLKILRLDPLLLAAFECVVQTALDLYLLDVLHF